jgi:hypothetical protein
LHPSLAEDSVYQSLQPSIFFIVSDSGSGQYDLFISFSDPGLDFSQYLLRGDMALSAPSPRHDAVRAGLAAAILDLDQSASAKRRRWARFAAWTGADYLSPDDIWQSLLILIADHESDTINLAQFLASPLGIAAGDHNNSLGVLAMGQPQKMTTLAVGDVSYGAGVKHINIRVGIRGHDLISSLEEPSRQTLALCLIQLATYGLDAHLSCAEYPWPLFLRFAHLRRFY